jgi:SpoIIAA-like
MLSVTRIGTSAVVELAYEGGLESAEVDEVRAMVERVGKEHGRVRLLAVVERIGKLPMDVLKEQSGGLDLVKLIDRAALVTDTMWLTLGAKARAKSLPFEVKTFKRRDRDKALAWLQE